MVRRRADTTVQLKLRIKEPLRASAERRARRRGASLNQEIADCLELARMPELLSSGIFDLHDLARFAAHLKLVKDAMRSAGFPECEWPTHARTIPFPLDPSDAADQVEIVKVWNELRAKADAELAELHATLAGEGDAPAPDRARRSPHGAGGKESYRPIAERKAAARRIAEIEAVRKTHAREVGGTE